MDSIQTNNRHGTERCSLDEIADHSPPLFPDKSWGKIKNNPFFIHKKSIDSLLDIAGRIIYLQTKSPGTKGDEKRDMFCMQGSHLVCICDLSRGKGHYGNCKKVSNLISLRSPSRLTKVETFRYWQIFCVLSDNSK